ncbi:protein mono-ADP-ribosyltransferase PARP14-like [Hyperolius riggenbachi]|uniref:protein mono-ADP-ribosyltransferase PARP14-like n=1 Tax=Hyperolius riggenbachi TaxID=752182 RepID=UPI0035A36972
MGDPNFCFPVALNWDQGPQKLEQLKRKVLLHFQNRRKSGGGECEIRDYDCSRGYILIYFREEGVRDEVLRKSHEMKLQDGKKLQLVVCPAEAGDMQTVRTPPPSQEVAVERRGEERKKSAPDLLIETPRNNEMSPGQSSSVILIENLQDSCTPDMLNLLLENITEKNVDMDFYVERLPEIRTAVVTFTSDTDIADVITRFSGSIRVKQLKLTARTLEETRSVRAEGIPPDTPEDMVTLYFESPRHGGGTIEDTVLLPDEGAALVTFHRAEVVQTVMTKPHELNNKTVHVYPYYPSIGQWLYGKTEPRIETPDPVRYPIDPPTLEFFYKNAQIKQTIEKQMSDHNCEVTWPDPGHSSPVITLSFPSILSAHVRTLAKIAPTWATNVKKEFKNLMSKYKVIKCDLTPQVWEAIRGTVPSSSYDGVLVKPDNSIHKVFMVGMSEDVSKLEPTFRKLVEETSKRLSRVEDEVPLEQAVYRLMFMHGLESTIQVDSPNVKFSYDASAKKVKLCGPKDDVLAAKCQILKSNQEMKTKSINLDPYIIQFLTMVDNEDLSESLFRGNKIKAMFQVEDKAITLTGSSSKDLTNAEEKMKKELVCKRISIEDKSVTKTPQWRSIQGFLMETFNSATMTVLIEEFPVGEGMEVAITGLSSSAEETYQQIHDYVEKNTMVQKDIKLRSLAVLQFIEEERKPDWNRIVQHVKIAKNQNFITLSGPKLYVEEAENRITELSSTLQCDSLYIDKPGAKKFCIDNEDMFVTTVKKKFNCVMHLQKEGNGGNVSQESNPAETICQVPLKNGTKVVVYKGDLCRQNTEVIIIASNEDLMPTSGTGISVMKAAGPKPQAECRSIVQKEGKLASGECEITGAGNLLCKKVIHAVGPKWDNRPNSKYERLLRKAVTSALEKAIDNSYRSVALSVGDFVNSGCPVDLCAENIVKAIKLHFEKHERAITTIHLVDSNDTTLKILMELLKEEFRDEIVQVTPKHSPDKPLEPPKKAEIIQVPGQMVTTKENLQIKIMQGNIEDVKTDVVVNSVGKELNLRSGAVSKALLSRAGSNLQDLLNKEKREKQVEDGSLFVTDSCNLSCGTVIHAVVPQYDGPSSEKILKKIIHDCLSTMESRNLRSITIPAMGTGILGFPRNKVAELMFEEILDFSSSKKVQHLKEVFFMLHPSDLDTIKAFSSELQKKISADGQNQKKPQTSFGTVTSPSQGVHELTLGSITYQVKTGDITKETCDVIINSTSSTFNLKSGVSKAILEGAGPNIESECARLGTQPNNGYAITTGGNLPCKHIIHIAGQAKPDLIKKCVINALHECEKLQVTSVAFPAMGTGAGNVGSALVADAILDAVEECFKSKSATTLQLVKVVLFQPQMLNDFHASMKKKETPASASAAPKSWFSKITTFFTGPFSSSKAEDKEEKVVPKVFELKENIEPAIVHLCAEKREDVKEASVWLRELIEKEQHENTIADEWIQYFDDNDHQKLAQLQKKHGVTIHASTSTIRVRGLTRDVLEVSNKIQDMAKSVRDKKTREHEAELCSNVVEWGYYQGTNFIPFDKMTNLDLENARTDKTSSLNIDIAGVKYTVIIEGEKARDSKGNKVLLKRIPKNEHLLVLPPYWDTQDITKVKAVSVAPGSAEYTEVETLFRKTCHMRIIKIERIQNKHLYESYQIKKNSIDTKNNTKNNERRLFHGTNQTITDGVNNNGFNRSYAGNNATALGKGTYFAVDANYSADDTYSKPDANGYKYMYLARVLTGECCKGNNSMIVPPSRNPANPTDLYDSAADNVNNPTVFVIFSDTQAYPEYLITFTK